LEPRGGSERDFITLIRMKEGSVATPEEARGEDKKSHLQENARPRGKNHAAGIWGEKKKGGGIDSFSPC